MDIRKSLQLMLCLLLLSACAQAPVSFDYDTAAQMPAVKSFALTEPPSGAQFQSIDNQRIEAALRRQMTAKGLKEVARDKADMLLAYRVEPERKLQESSGFSFGFGVASGNVGLGVSTGPKPKEIVEGRLVVDAVDPQRQQVVWTAKANRNLRDSMSPAQRDELINSLVAAMFIQFPPVSP